MNLPILQDNNVKTMSSPNDLMVFPNMSVAVIYMMHKYITNFDYEVDIPTRDDAVFSLIDSDGDQKAELLTSGKVVEFGCGYEEYTTQKQVSDFYAQSASVVNGMNNKIAHAQESQDSYQAVSKLKPKIFSSYDEAYFILKSYYHDLLGFSITIPEVIGEGVLITLKKDDSVVELFDGWWIAEDGETLTHEHFIEIIELDEIINAKNPKKSGLSMGAFETMMYWRLEHKTKIVIAKRKKAQRIKTYLIHNPNSNLYKIGKSINPGKRVVDIQGMAGNPLDILYIIHGDVEHELHMKFATQNHYSEWFTDEGGSIQAYFKSNGEAWEAGCLESEGQRNDRN